MKPYSKSSRNRGSIIRPPLAALLMLGGIALLARAGGLANQTAPTSASAAGSPQAPQAPAASPGLPRFFNYASPPGIADDVGEPSIGCNWKSETSSSNSMFSIPNGGRVMLFGGFSPAPNPGTFDDCSSPAKPNRGAKPLLLPPTPRDPGGPHPLPR